MIHVHGDGIAALTFAHQMILDGVSVRVFVGAPIAGPIVLLGEDTLRLLCDVFNRKDLLEIGHPVPFRLVSWHSVEAKTVAAPSRSIPLVQLVEHLRAGINDAHFANRDERAFDNRVRWRIDGTGRGSHLAKRIAGVKTVRLGNRHVVACTVRIRDQLDHAIMEQLPREWLFAFPISTTHACVQLMCPNRPANLELAVRLGLANSDMIRNIVRCESLSIDGCFAAAPSILNSIGSTRWLAIGNAAVSYDPICGDGIGASVHSSLLAAAVVRSFGTENAQSLLDHYEARHQQALARHLETTSSFYSALRRNEDWSSEIAVTDRFLRGELGQNVVVPKRLTHRLVNGRLTPVTMASGVNMARARHH